MIPCELSDEIKNNFRVFINKIFETSEGAYLYLGIKEVQIKIYDRKRRRDIII